MNATEILSETLYYFLVSYQYKSLSGQIPHLAIWNASQAKEMGAVIFWEIQRYTWLIHPFYVIQGY